MNMLLCFVFFQKSQEVRKEIMQLREDRYNRFAAPSKDHFQGCQHHSNFIIFLRSDQEFGQRNCGAMVQLYIMSSFKIVIKRFTSSGDDFDPS